MDLARQGTALRRAAGLGSAKSGTGHFIWMNLTSIALVPLTVWFLWFAIAHLGATHAAYVAALKNPFNATLMLAFLLAGVYHFMIGLQVVIEDYVHGPTLKIWTLFANVSLCALLGLACVVALLQIAL